jgi:NAD+ kinase
MRIAFLAAQTEAAQAARAALAARYGDAPPEAADVIVALGGDGAMLEAQHRFLGQNRPIYGMNRGSVGFLMNDYREEALPERLAAAQATHLHPLRMAAETAAGTQVALAINEVSLLRETRQAAKLRILVDGKARLAELVCDGVIVSTPAGSTAYNLSAHGRSTRGCCRSRPSPPSGRAAGAARCCPPPRASSSRCSSRTSAPSRRPPTTPRCATSAASRWARTAA